ncbi:hypothetical protein QY895_07585 [Latilactobacillus sakei]
MAMSAGFKLATTVFPFILRGVTLVGIDSVNYPRKDRKEIWQLLATNFKPQIWPQIRTIAFSELATELDTPIKQTGRVVVKIDTEH